MRFLHVDPTARTVTPVEAENPHNAVPKLAALNVDHGIVHVYDAEVGIGIFVYEYGLLEGEGPYFTLSGQLYAGDAILYAFDLVSRDTVAMPQRWDGIGPLWLDTKADVEAAIRAGLVQRPETRVNGKLMWQWS